MSSDLHFVFAGGGSGGHLFPALAVAQELRALSPDCSILFFVGERSVDHQIASTSGIEFISMDVPTASQLWRSPWRGFPQMWRALQTVQSRLRTFGRGVVIGTGGYVSIPVGWGARRCGWPLVLLEPNAVPGRATSWLSRWAREIYLGTEGEAGRLPSACHVTGVPVRKEIAHLATFPVDLEERSTLLILGGSQGARDLNTVVLAALAELQPWNSGWQIVHQTGAADLDRVRQAHEELAGGAQVVPFLAEMATAYAHAGLVISRAGAITLAELACAGLPAILYPHPQAVRNHQLRNAEHLAHRQAAELVTGTDLRQAGQSLMDSLRRLIEQRPQRQQLALSIRRLAKPDAALQIARHVLEMAYSTTPIKGK